MVTSTTPKAAPSATHVINTVRTALRPERARARRRPLRSAGRAHGRREREPDGPDPGERRGRDERGPGRRDRGDGGHDQRAEDEEDLLQPGLERVGRVAQARFAAAGSARARACSRRRVAECLRRARRTPPGRAPARPAWPRAPGLREPPDTRRRAAAVRASDRCGPSACPRAEIRSRRRPTTRRSRRPRRRTSGPRRAPEAPSRAAPCRSATARAAPPQRCARRRERAARRRSDAGPPTARSPPRRPC